jgi:hypothetical protein
MSDQKRELKLEDLVGYFPYGLLGNYNESICILQAISTDVKKLRVQEYNRNAEMDWCKLSDFKPLLRPLQDLTKEIEHEGETIIPIKVLCDIERSDLYWSDEHDIEVIEDQVVVFHNGYESMWEFKFDTKDMYFSGTFRNDGTTTEILNQIELFRKLHELHFDLYGLIEAGLAVNLNDVK